MPFLLTLVKTLFKLPTSLARPLISPIALLTPPICSITLLNDCFSLSFKVFSNFSLTTLFISSSFDSFDSLITFKFSFTFSSSLSNDLLIESLNSFNTSLTDLLNSLISYDNFSFINNIYILS